MVEARNWGEGTVREGGQGNKILDSKESQQTHEVKQFELDPEGNWAQSKGFKQGNDKIRILERSLQPLRREQIGGGQEQKQEVP